MSSANVSLNSNIFLSKVSLNAGVIKNNIFLYYNGNVYYPASIYCNNSIIENNVFKSFNSGGGNIFRNNINGGVNGTDGNGNQGSGNFSGYQPLDSIFINFNSNSGWSYSSNFHLRPGSPYHNQGTDNTDIGIYGGIFPWNEGSVPSNPHIYFKQIAPQTGSNGKLNVQVKVRTNN